MVDGDHGGPVRRDVCLVERCFSWWILAVGGVSRAALCDGVFVGVSATMITGSGIGRLAHFFVRSAGALGLAGVDASLCCISCFICSVFLCAYLTVSGEALNVRGRVGRWLLAVV